MLLYEIPILSNVNLGKKNFPLKKRERSKLLHVLFRSIEQVLIDSQSLGGSNNYYYLMMIRLGSCVRYGYGICTVCILRVQPPHSIAFQYG